MNIYYYANHVYQFSNVFPLYRKIGGTFIIKNRLSRKIEFYRFLHGINPFPEEKTLFNTPKMIKRNVENFNDLEGIIFSQSVTKLPCNPKKCKTIFVGHGTGDKKYETNFQDLKSYDYQFIVGPKHLEKLKDVGVDIVPEKQISIGNMRFDDYVNQKINKEKILNNLGVKDRHRKNVLYAPTWRWGHGTFKTHVHQFCREITKEFNLIVRPHFHGAQHIPELKLWAKFNGIKNVYFSNPANLKRNDTMFDFAISDILISDTSSILYEYLITGNPIIIVKTNFENLHSMPDKMNIMSCTDIYDGSKDIVRMINENLYQQKNKSLYEKMLNNCFYYTDGKAVERAVQLVNTITHNLSRL